MEFISTNRGARALTYYGYKYQINNEGEKVGFSGDAPIPELVAEHLQH